MDADKLNVKDYNVVTMLNLIIHIVQSQFLYHLVQTSAMNKHRVDSNFNMYNAIKIK